MKKNLIIGAITNYIWEDVEPFFVSYAGAGFENTDCVMFTYNMSRRTLNKIRACGVQVLPMSPIPKEFMNKEWVAVVVNYRWKLYSEFLKRHSDEYQFVFALDVRDAIFQSDVFKFFNESPFLGLAIEDGDLNEACNKKWIVDAYGQEVHEAVKDERIVCTGTIWGTCSEFQTFSDYMIETIFSRPRKMVRETLFEQAAGNVIIYHRKAFKDIIKFSDNISGSIMTIGLSDPAGIKLDANGNIYNSNGGLAAVVHQYDRKKLIVAMVKAKYCEPVTFTKKLVMKFDRLTRIPVRAVNKIRRMLFMKRA